MKSGTKTSVPAQEVKTLPAEMDAKPIIDRVPGWRGLTEEEKETVGQEFTLTRERMRQIEAKALRKLKHPSRSEKLKSFNTL